MNLSKNNTLISLIIFSLLITSALSSCDNCKYCSTNGIDCLECHDGYYFPTNPTSSTICTACPAGTTTLSGRNTCETCPAGTYSPAGSPSCTSCPAGQYAEKGINYCTKCPSGTSSSIIGSGSVNNCTPCPAGQYSELGSSICTKCPTGYSSSSGSAYCTKCPGGTYAEQGSSSCSRCAAGYYSADGSRSCTICPAGYYSIAGSSFCTKCSAGYYAGQGSSSCKQCQAGSYSTEGSGSCTSCPPGQYAEKGDNYCQDCAEGTYSSQGASRCSQCPAGSYSDNKKACKSCEKGYYSGPGWDSCSQCVAGTFSDKTRSSSCKKCTPGSVSEAGSDSCLSCSAGSFSNDGKTCQICKEGSYSGDGYSGCLACPENTYSFAGSGSCSLCPPGKVKYHDDGICYYCEANKWANPGDSTCKLCAANCDYCYDNMCLRCKQGYIVQRDPGTVKMICVLEPTEFIWAAATAKVSAISSTATATIAKALSPGSSVALRFGVVRNIAQNTRFFDINYSEDMQEVFAGQSSNALEIKSFNKEVDSRLMNKNFAKYNLKPSFLMNYWGHIIPIIILAVCLVTFEFFLGIMKQNIQQRGWAPKVIAALQISGANLLIVSLYGSFDEILFFFILELKTSKFNSGFAWLSLGCGLFFIGLAIAYFVLNYYIIKKYQAAVATTESGNDKEKKGLLRFEENHAQVKVFFEDFKDNSLSQQAFLMLFMIRGGLLSIIVCFLVDHPLVQASLYLGINLLFALFFVVKRPFKKLIMGSIAHYFCEVIILAISSIVLALAVLDHIGSEGVKSRQILGRIIVILGIVLSFGAVAFQCIDILSSIRRIYKACRGERAKIYTTPVAQEVENPDHNTTKTSVFDDGETQGKMNILKETLRILAVCCLPCKIHRARRLKNLKVLEAPKPVDGVMDQTFDPTSPNKMQGRKDSAADDMSGTSTDRNLIGRERRRSTVSLSNAPAGIRDLSFLEKQMFDTDPPTVKTEIEDGMPYAPNIEIYEVPLDIEEVNADEVDGPFAPNIEEFIAGLNDEDNNNDARINF